MAYQLIAFTTLNCFKVVTSIKPVIRRVPKYRTLEGHCHCYSLILTIKKNVNEELAHLYGRLNMLLSLMNTARP